MSDTTAEILPFGRGLLARRGTAVIVRQHPSGTSALYRPSGEQIWPSASLANRRLASLTAAARRVEHRALLKAIQDKAESEGLTAREVSRRTGLNRMALARLTRGSRKTSE